MRNLLVARLRGGAGLIGGADGARPPDRRGYRMVKPASIGSATPVT